MSNNRKSKSFMSIFNVRVLIASYVNSFEDFLNLRRINKDFKDTIDDNDISGSINVIRDAWIMFLGEGTKDYITIQICLNNNFYILKQCYKYEISLYTENIFYMIEDLGMAQYLISKGIRPDPKIHLLNALLNNRTKTVNIFSKMNIFLDTFTIQGKIFNSLIIASKVSLEMTEIILMRGVSPDVKNTKRYYEEYEEDDYLVHIACYKNDLEMLKLLIKYKADVNKPGKYGKSILHILIEENNFIILENLLKLKKDKINMNVKDYFEKTPIIKAIESNREEIFKLLLNNTNFINEIKADTKNNLTKILSSKSPELYSLYIKYFLIMGFDIIELRDIMIEVLKLYIKEKKNNNITFIVKYDITKLFNERKISITF
jgi:ankyrin repeat protein